MKNNTDKQYLYSVEFMVKPTNFSSDLEARWVTKELYSNQEMSYNDCKKWASVEMYHELSQFSCIMSFNYTYKLVEFNKV